MSSKISSEFIDSVHNHQHETRPNKKAKTSKSAAVFKKTVSEKPVNVKKYPFTPTKRAAWTKEEANIGTVTAGIFNTVARPLIMLKLTEDGKNLFKTLDFSTLKTVGDIEKFSLKLMKQEMRASYERCEEVHGKLRDVLQVFAEKGMTGALPSIVSLIMNP